MTKKKEEALVGEVIISEDPGWAPGSTRKLRVYDRRGDFVIWIRRLVAEVLPEDT